MNYNELKQMFETISEKLEKIMEVLENTVFSKANYK